MTSSETGTLTTKQALEAKMSEAVANGDFEALGTLGNQYKKLQAEEIAKSVMAEQSKRAELQQRIEKALEPFVKEIESLTSVTTVSILIGDEVIVTTSGRKASNGNGGGGGGHKYLDPKTNELVALGDIWNKFATPEDIAKYEAETSGSKRWNQRVNVAKANGYVANK